MIGIFELAVLFFILVYIFNKNSALNMLDQMQERFWDAWGSDNRPGDSIYTGTNMRTVSDQIRREQAKRREMQRQLIENELYKIKEQSPPTILPKTRPIVGLSCKSCVPGSKAGVLDSTQRRRNVNNILNIPKPLVPAGPLDWTTWFPILARVLSLKWYSYPQMAPTVIPDDRMQSAIHQAAEESVNEKKEAMRREEDFDEESYYQEMVIKHTKRAGKLLKVLHSTISDRFLRFAAWLVYRLVPCFLTGVAAHPAHIEMLKAASKNSDDVPMIFLPLHRSHLDYILVSFILMSNNIRSPIVAAGNNLNIPIFGSWLRYAGAFFIKRRIDPVGGKKDIVYRTLLHTYLQKCLSAGHHVEFFIEGGRTRTGKPCMPKSGILSVIIDACMDGTIRDALLVPVSINYEKIIDGNFVSEQLGQKKVPETFTTALSAIWKTLHSQYGIMRIDFNEPFSLRALVDTFNKQVESSTAAHRALQQVASTSSLFGTDVVNEEQRSLSENIARHIVYDCANATSVMSTNALAFLLLSRFRDGATMDILIEAFNQLREDLADRRDLGFTGSSEDVIRYAANLLGPGLVKVEKKGVKTFIRPITMIPNVIELFYYANTLMPFYALEAAVVTAALYLNRVNEITGLSTEVEGLPETELIKRTQELCDMLRYEFIFIKPCQNPETVLADVIANLSHKNFLHKPPTVERTEEEQRAQRLSHHLDVDLSDEDDDNEPVEKPYTKVGQQSPSIFLPAEKHLDRLTLITVLAPLTHAYLAVAHTLCQLIGCNSIVESDFIRMCVKEMTNRVERGTCKYSESISTDTIRNCIKLFEKWGVVVISSRTGAKLISLHPVYDSALGVKTTVERIEKFVID